jgi:hypothetical protein
MEQLVVVGRRVATHDGVIQLTSFEIRCQEVVDKSRLSETYRNLA